MNFFTFLLRRSKYHWLLLITLVLGTFLASAFLASGPVLIDALLNFGLRRIILNANARDDIYYMTLRESSQQDQYQIINDHLLQFFDDRLTYLDLHIIPAGHVGFMYPWQNSQLSPSRRLTLGFYGSDPDDLSQHMDFEVGSFPVFNHVEEEAIQVYIGGFLADSLDLSVGDLLPVSFSAQTDHSELYLQITGIVTPQNHYDAYWLDHFNPFWPMEGSGDQVQYGVFVSQEAFFELASRLYPSLDVSYSWQGNIEVDQVKFDDLEDILIMFNSLGNEILTIHDGLQINSILGDVLSEYSNQANIVRAPLYFLLGIVVLMALYYLVMMSSLYLEQRRSEFAVIRSRGAPGGLLLKLELWEGLLFSAVSILGGPFLAWLIVRWLSYYGPLAVLTKPSWGLSIPQAAWLSALIAAVASVCSLLVPLPHALKQSIATHQQNLTRAARQPWWQRFYLDIFTLAIGIVLLYRVKLYGSIIGGSAATPQLDLVLILAPLSLLIGTAAIFLRIFPVFLQKSADLASRGSGLPIVLALRQAARDPTHVTRLVLLLMLAMALGLFSTSLDATLMKNEVDRASYYVGSDFRVIADPASIETDELVTVTGESILWRSEADFLTSNATAEIDLLAIDPRTFPAVSQFRSDFATQSVPHLIDRLIEDWEENWIPLPTTYLPGEPASIGLWLSLPFSMYIDPTRFDRAAQTSFEMRLHTSQMEDFTVILEPLQLKDDPTAYWYYFQGELPELSPNSYPLSLISIWIHNTDLQWETYEPMWIDDISVVDRLTGNETIIESFEYEDPYVWNSMTLQLSTFSIEANPHTGKSSLALFFEASGMSPLRWYGINRVDDSAFQPIPALVSPNFVERTELQPGDLVRLKVKLPERSKWDDVSFKIIDVVDYFPTLYQSVEASFLVTLKGPLFEQMNAFRRSFMKSNEFLIKASDSTTTHDSLLGLGLPRRQVISADVILDELRSNPLTIGLRSVTLFGYFLTTILSVVGFGTHFYLSTRQRSTNYSILRALGLSPGQLYATLLLEQTILMFSGLALGTILGLLLNQLTLAGLPLRLGDLETVPPFLVQTDWILVLRVYLTLVIAFLISLGLAIFFLWRIRIHRVLRIGEE